MIYKLLFVLKRMMFKTHLAVGVLLILLFLPVVAFNKVVFVVVLLACTFLPDIDMSQSYMGKHKILRPIQWFVKHRGFFHSFTFTVIATLIFTFYIPILALPFFLGYAGHLISDALTPEGIRPWWPFRKEIEGFFRTGKMTEKVKNAGNRMPLSYVSGVRL